MPELVQSFIETLWNHFWLHRLQGYCALTRLDSVFPVEFERSNFIPSFNITNLFNKKAIWGTAKRKYLTLVLESSKKVSFLDYNLILKSLIRVQKSFCFLKVDLFLLVLLLLKVLPWKFFLTKFETFMSKGSITFLGAPFLDGKLEKSSIFSRLTDL